MKVVKIYRGTNIKEGTQLLNKQFNDISWWGDGYQTMAHYNEGCIVQIEVKLDETKQQDYLYDKLNLTDDIIKQYTYGYEEMLCPKGEIWYSFGASYLKENVLNISIINLDSIIKYVKED